MAQVEDRPAVFQAVDELAAIATTPEDQAQVAEWNAEAEKDRAVAVANLGHETVNFVEQDGIVATVEEAQASAAASPSGEQGTYDNGRRS